MSGVIDVNYTAEQMAERYLMEKERVERLTAEVTRLTAREAALVEALREAKQVTGKCANEYGQWEPMRPIAVASLDQMLGAVLGPPSGRG